LLTIEVVRGKIQTIMSYFEIRKPTVRANTPLLVHIPHSATAVPDPWRSDLLLDEAALERELLAMTDRYTDELFGPAALAHGGAAFINNLRRLAFDPERFEDDSQEVMSAKGMGAVYMNPSAPP
jgi:N-formylglutamate deformylase